MRPTELDALQEKHQNQVRSVVGFSMIWGFPKMGAPKNGWFVMENTI